MFDVIVVGGNLSGATAAIKASEKGLKVALVERNKKPFDPAHCGEMLFDAEARTLNLDSIGCPKNEVNKAILTVPTREYAFKFKKSRIIIFNRNFVERKLLEKAGKNGTKLLIGTSMKEYRPPNEIVLDNNEIIKGKIIVDASGIVCHVGKQIGMETKLEPRDIGVCIQSRVKSNFEDNTIKCWFHKPYAPFGYAWLFPVNNDIANIGLGVPGGKKLDLAKLLNNYIKEVTSNDYEIISSFRSCVPLAQPMKKVVKDNVLITGDAARFAHSLSGGGIVNALFSGSLAGNIAAKYIHGEITSLNCYQDLLQKKISRLEKEYHSRIKAIKSDDSYITKFRMVFFIASFVNRLLPNLFEKAFSDLTKKDDLVLKSLNESPYIL